MCEQSHIALCAADGVVQPKLLRCLVYLVAAVFDWQADLKQLVARCGVQAIG